MPRIIALAGISGSGKTYTREHDPRLKDLPFVDIADIYEEYPQGLQAAMALSLLLNRVEELIETGEEAVVVEAYFRRGSNQRAWLEYTVERLDASVEYIEINTPVEVCIERVRNQYEEFLKQPGVTQADIERMKRFTEARLEILGSIISPSGCSSAGSNSSFRCSEWPD